MRARRDHWPVRGADRTSESIRRGAFLTLAVGFLLLVPLVSLAEDSRWSIAERSDDIIKKLVAKLHEKLPGHARGSQEAAVVLTRKFYLEAELGGYQICDNEVMYVFDQAADELAVKEFWFPPGRKIESVAAWIYRDKGKLQRLKDENIEIQKGDDHQGPTARISFPEVKAKDTLGWSVVTKGGGMFMGRFLRLSGPHPVKRFSVRLIGDGKLDFQLLPFNLRQGGLGSKVYAKENEKPSDILYVATDLPAARKEPFGLPCVSREPYVQISIQGIFAKEMDQWLYSPSWNHEAMNASMLLEEVLLKDVGKVPEEARRLVAGLGSNREKISALCRFVRDEVALEGSFEYRVDLRQPKDMIESRRASRWGKGILLYALCREAGLPARVVYVRSRNEGPLDDKNPDFQQFSDFLVELESDPDSLLYAPACQDCPPGVLPVALRGVQALRVESGLKDKVQALQMAVFQEIGAVPERFMDVFQTKVTAQEWCDFGLTPGDPSEVAGAVFEEIRFEPATGSVELSLSATGFSDLARLCSENDGQATDCVQAYLADRFPGCSVAGAAVQPADPAAPRNLAFSVRVQLTDPTAAAGDSWEIPAGAFSGQNRFAFWTGPGRGPFHAGQTSELRTLWRAPLPAGWPGIATQEPVVVEHPAVSFSTSVRAEDGDLVVERRCLIRQGTVAAADLADLDAAIERIREVEGNPLEVQRPRQ